MAKTAMAIEREVDDTRSIRDAGVSDRTSTPRGFQGQCQGQVKAPS